MIQQGAFETVVLFSRPQRLLQTPPNSHQTAATPATPYVNPEETENAGLQAPDG